MSTMQAFYNRLLVAPDQNNAANSRLAKLTGASLKQLAALDDGWVWWS